MSRFLVGQTGLIVPIPAVEPVVAQQRLAHDSSAAYGVPAHVTVLFPFIALDEVDDAGVAGLGEICTAQPAFDVELAGVGRFPGVAWLAPEPDQPFRRLTASVVARWPDHLPYEGAFDDVVPHLTVAEGDDEVLDAAERAVLPGLPVRTRVTELVLIGFDGARWNPVQRFRFGAQTSIDDRSP